MYTRRAYGGMNMSKDPIVEEVRKIRHQIESDYKNDSDKYYEHLLNIQKKYRRRLIKRQPQRKIKDKPVCV